jgi:ribose 5-phosphate isomerase B
MSNFALGIASDHAGFELKTKIVNFLQKNDFRVLDLGTDSKETVDYPDYAKKLTNEIVEETITFGILICGTGIGMSMAANRNSEIRAALCTNEFMAERARLHNDANVLVLGSKISDEETAINITQKFLKTNFEGGRHSNRLKKMV